MLILQKITGNNNVGGATVYPYSDNEQGAVKSPCSFITAYVDKSIQYSFQDYCSKSSKVAFFLNTVSSIILNFDQISSLK